MDGARDPERRGGRVEGRSWQEVRADLTLMMTPATWGAIIEPLDGWWHEGRLLITGPHFASAWASHRFVSLIQQAAQAEVRFVEW